MSGKQSVALAGALATDTRGLDQLKLQAKKDPKGAIQGAARQFEAVFLNMVMKSMREATPKDGMFDSEQTRFYTSMLDQQLSQHVASRGTGLADVMAKQLARGMSEQPEGEGAAGQSGVSQPLSLAMLAPSLPPSISSMQRALESGEPLTSSGAPELDAALPLMPPPTAAPNAAAAPVASSQPVPAAPMAVNHTRGFVNKVWPHAVEAARSLGVQPQFIVGQAALESGWGRREIRTADGRDSHNLFGIKAGRGWNGPSVDKVTIEYVNGAPQRSVEKFRVYGSYAEAFKDYASLLSNNSRYSGAVGRGGDAVGFAKGLQRGGYATDPAYADKLVRVINSGTMRASLQSEPTSQYLARR